MVRRNRQMCVKIAKDVIAQLRLERFSATPGTYINVDIYSVDMLDDNYDMSFKDFFKKNKEVKCDVCALGAAFVSLVNIENQCSVDQVQDASDSGIMWSRLEKYFGNLNMKLMESAFECTVMDPDDDASIYCLLQEAGNWGNQYRDDNERLRAIMLNVIRNNGDFKLPKKLVAKAKKNQEEYIDSMY